MAGAKKGSVFVRWAGPVGEKPLSLFRLPWRAKGGLQGYRVNRVPVSPNSFQSPRVPPAKNSIMAAIGASEINKEESTEKNVSKIVQG